MENTTPASTENKEAIQYVPLYGKHGKGKFAKVSSHWFGYLMQFRWYCDNKGYARRLSKKERSSHYILMHQEIAGFPKGFLVDHKDGDPLNNMDNNLRIATYSQNQMNKHKRSRKETSSKYKGVAYCKQTKLWTASIMSNGKKTFLGYFNLEDDAARSRDEAAIRLHGEFAALSAPHLAPISAVLLRRKKQTSSRFKGVSFRADSNKWRAFVMQNGKLLSLGSYLTETEAVKARDNYIRKNNLLDLSPNFPAEATP